MNKDFYILANRIPSSDNFAEETSGSFSQKQYQRSVLAAIRREKHLAGLKHLAAAAACLVIIIAAGGIFHHEVQAGIEQFHYSLGSALGLGNSLARYKEAVHTSVTSGDYVITLQEAAAAYEKLYVTCTIQRKDGKAVSSKETFSWLYTQLFINGQEINGGIGMSGGFLDQQRKTWKVLLTCSLDGTDLSGKNVYELKLSDLENQEKGTWKFKFRADGSELYADTKIMELDNRYVLPDGTVVTLDRLSLNRLEQRITFHLSGKKCIDNFELRVKDEQGRTAKFELAGCAKGKGSLVNTYVPDGKQPVKTWIADDAKKLTVTAYLTDIPEKDRLNPDDYKKRIGKKVIWDLSKMKSEKNNF